MAVIKLEKRYPHSRDEDITDAFITGYQQGKEVERRWWSAHCANCKEGKPTEEALERARFVGYKEGVEACNKEWRMRLGGGCDQYEYVTSRKEKNNGVR